jgi:hypothetical protein
MPRLRHGHAPGHVRDTALEAFAAWLDWDRKPPEPTVDYEIGWVPRPIPLTYALGLVWNCTDIVPGHVFDSLLACGVEPRRRTYAACARAVLRSTS